MIQSIVAIIKVKDGQSESFAAAASRLAAAVQAKEPGCILYTLNRGEDPLTYVFMERYRDADAVAAHRATEHYKTIGREMGAFMDGPPTVMRMQEIA
jgi:quinol monooxygenase YgiN